MSSSDDDAKCSFAEHLPFCVMLHCVVRGAKLPLMYPHSITGVSTCITDILLVLNGRQSTNGCLHAVRKR
jgi:hypothetical protein